MPSLNTHGKHVKKVANESNIRSVVRSGTCGRIHAKEAGWQSGVRSCITARLPTPLVHGLNACTVFLYHTQSLGQTSARGCSPSP